MKTLFNKKAMLGIVMSLTLLGATQVSVAQEDQISILNEIKEYVKNFAAHFGFDVTAAPEEPEPSPDLEIMQKANAAAHENTINTTIIPTRAGFDNKFDQPPHDNGTAISLTHQAIQNFLSTTANCPNRSLCLNSEDILNYMASFEMSLPEGTEELFPGGALPKSSHKQQDKTLDLNSLLGPNAIRLEEGHTTPLGLAMNYIRFAASQAMPIDSLGADILEKLDPPARNAYLVSQRIYTSLESVGLSNLYQMLARRLVTPELGTKAGMDKPDASQLEVDNFIANRRITDPNWYTKMEQASPLVIQREMLYVLAAMQRQFNEQKIMNERILATLSAIQLQALNGSGRGNINAFLPEEAGPPPIRPEPIPEDIF